MLQPGFAKFDTKTRSTGSKVIRKTSGIRVLDRSAASDSGGHQVTSTSTSKPTTSVTSGRTVSCRQPVYVFSLLMFCSFVQPCCRRTSSKASSTGLRASQVRIADAQDVSRLLSSRRKRPRRCTASQRHELAPFPVEHWDFLKQAPPRALQPSAEQSFYPNSDSTSPSGSRLLRRGISTGLMTALGQSAKYSHRADVFRFASKLRHRVMRSALRFVPNPEVVGFGVATLIYDVGASPQSHIGRSE